MKLFSVFSWRKIHTIGQCVTSKLYHCPIQVFQSIPCELLVLCLLTKHFELILSGAFHRQNKQLAILEDFVILLCLNLNLDLLSHLDFHLGFDLDLQLELKLQLYLQFHFELELDFAVFRLMNSLL